MLLFSNRLCISFVCQLRATSTNAMQRVIASNSVVKKSSRCENKISSIFLLPSLFSYIILRTVNRDGIAERKMKERKKQRKKNEYEVKSYDDKEACSVNTYKYLFCTTICQQCALSMHKINTVSQCPCKYYQLNCTYNSSSPIYLCSCPFLCHLLFFVVSPLEHLKLNMFVSISSYSFLFVLQLLQLIHFLAGT